MGAISRLNSARRGAVAVWRGVVAAWRGDVNEREAVEFSALARIPEMIVPIKRRVPATKIAACLLRRVILSKDEDSIRSGFIALMLRKDSTPCGLC